MRKPLPTEFDEDTRKLISSMAKAAGVTFDDIARRAMSIGLLQISVSIAKAQERVLSDD